MISAITSLVTGVELVTELLSAAVLLMALDKLATAIRWTYRAGYVVGTAWHRYGVPAVLWTADHVSALIAAIDWQQVGAALLTAAKVITAAAITIWTLTCDAHKRWIGDIDWSLPAAPVAPAINPLFDAAIELEQLTCKQLRSLTGSRRRCRKSELIGGWIAC